MKLESTHIDFASITDLTNQYFNKWVFCFKNFEMPTIRWLKFVNVLKSLLKVALVLGSHFDTAFSLL